MRGIQEYKPTKPEKEFWEAYSGLLLDDPEEELNELIGELRNVATKYFENERISEDIPTFNS